MSETHHQQTNSEGQKKLNRQTGADGNQQKQADYLFQAVKECEEELRAIGIPVGHVAEVRVNTRARKRWGQCRQEADGFHISISDRLLGEETREGLRDTILHELLHTCPLCGNHGAMWKHYAEYVNSRLHANVKRINSNEEKGLPPEEEARVLHRYHCAVCGQVVTKQRECKFTKNYSLYRCGVCGGRFVKDF